MDELEMGVEKQRSEAIKIKETMGALITSEGWKLFDAVLAEKEQHMLSAILNATVELSDVTLREYRMGLTTIRTIRTMPEAMLDDAEATLNEFRKEEEENLGNERKLEFDYG